MPTFTSVTLDRFLEPGEGKSPKRNMPTIDKKIQFSDTSFSFPPTPHTINQKRNETSFFKNFSHGDASVQQEATEKLEIQKGNINGKDVLVTAPVLSPDADVVKTYEKFTGFHNGKLQDNNMRVNVDFSESEAQSEDFFDPRESMSVTSSVETDDTSGNYCNFKLSTPMAVFYDAPDENSTSLVSCHQPQPLARCQTIPFGVPMPSDASLMPDVDPCIKAEIDSGVTIANPSPSSMGALSVTVPPPLCRKSRQTEVNSQRRIRRPFAVPEVEALVRAVEKLGTGRWRDVKVDYFYDAKHRTYVDLKDKWKTLVHTARIAPQQRRGEALPQELLDRVLAAHAYWSDQHQVKQQSIHLLESH